MRGPLKIAIDVPYLDAKIGGQKQFVMGLAHGLSRLTDGDEEYLFFTHSGSMAWLRPCLSGPCRAVPKPEPAPAPGSALKRLVKRLEPAWFSRNFIAKRDSKLKDFLKRLEPAWIKRRRQSLVQIWWRRSLQGNPLHLPPADSTVEALGADLAHFPTQKSYGTHLPVIYQPHDLNHRHFPQFFAAEAMKRFDAEITAHCGKADLIVMMSRHGKRDLQAQLGIPPEKIAVIPGGSTFEAFEAPTPDKLAAIRGKFRLPDRYLFYPALTVEHKNHLGLIRAVARLRDSRRLDARFIFTGHQTAFFFGKIEKEIEALGLREQCRFLGYLNQDELQGVLRLARGMVFPSLFEGWGLPLTEAMHAGVPAAVADNSMLTEQGGDAVLAFDPFDVEAIAEAIRRLWTDDALCAALAEKGRQRAEAFQWPNVARIFRAHYRRLAQRPLNDEDRLLVERSLGPEPY